jgi:hypothetical protein
VTIWTWGEIVSEDVSQKTMFELHVEISSNKGTGRLHPGKMLRKKFFLLLSLELFKGKGKNVEKFLFI